MTATDGSHAGMLRAPREEKKTCAASEDFAANQAVATRLLTGIWILAAIGR